MFYTSYLPEAHVSIAAVNMTVSSKAATLGDETNSPVGFHVIQTKIDYMCIKGTYCIFIVSVLHLVWELDISYLYGLATYFIHI